MHIASWIWVLIPLAAIAIAPFKMWLRMKEKQMEIQGQMTAEKSAQYAAHTERLEQRVRVLERIITDKGSDLATEIEDLRDRPLN
jgi:ABC-type phosphate transport system auxiliary subunit